MQKEYKAKSHVSINVTLPNGKNTHISFEPMTGGGSTFVTDNPKLQQGLEAHPKFGKMFKLASAKNFAAQAEKPQAAPAPESSEPSDAAPQRQSLEMPSLEDAKLYLVENFGISRTKLRSKKQIEEAGLAHGIEFIFD